MGSFKLIFVFLYCVSYCSCEFRESLRSVTSEDHVPGGISKEDVNKPEFRELAVESMQKYLKNAGITDPYKLLSIERVGTQIVAGKNTIIDFKITPVDQTKGDDLSCQSTIWEQSWKKIKQINVACAIVNHSRSKRQTGGISEQDPNNPQFRNLVEESMQKYLQDNDITQPFEIVAVEKITTQVVSGSMTRIDFKIKPTGKVNADTLSCHSEMWNQPWLKSKNIDVKCTVNEQSKVIRTRPGGTSEQDPNNPKYRKLATESMQQYLQNNGITNPYKIVSIESVTTQIVAGKITRIHFKITPIINRGDVLTCQSKIWEQKWTYLKNIDVNCRIEFEEKPKILGGITKEDPNNPKFRILAIQSMLTYLQRANISNPHKLETIKKVTTETVAGLITRIQFKIRPVDQRDNTIINCQSKIYEQPWLKNTDIDVHCIIDEQIGGGQLAGGISKDNPHKPEFRKLAENSMRKYLQYNNISIPYKIVQIKRVNTQTVAGRIIRIQFKIAPTTDRWVEVISSCQAKILKQEWLNVEDIDVHCIIDEEIYRQVPGGISGSLP